MRKIIYPLIVMITVIYILPWQKIFTAGYLEAYSSCELNHVPCHIRRAIDARNPYICSLLDPGKQDICYYKLIQDLPDSSAHCEAIEIPYYQKLCLEQDP